MFITLLKSMITLCSLMGLGYYFEKKAIFTDDMRKRLTEILLGYVMPCTFVMALQTKYNKELMENAIIILGISFLMHFLFIGIGYLSCAILKPSAKDKGVIIFAITFVNVSFMGFPVLVSVFPDAVQNPLFYGSLYCFPFNLLAFSFGAIILQPAGDKRQFRFKELITPVNVSILLGLLLFVSRITIPPVIGNTLNLIKNMAVPLSLILTGALLAKSDLTTIFKDKMVMVVNFIRLIICPVIFYFVLKIFHIDPYLLKISIILSMLPSASFTVILAEKYGDNSALASKIVLSSTIVSVLTIVFLSLFIL